LYANRLVHLWRNPEAERFEFGHVMKTLTLKIGGKEYEAAKLTIAEFSAAVKVFDAMQAAGAAGSLSEANRCIQQFTEIVCTSISKTGFEMTMEDIGAIATPEDIISAMGLLIHVDAPVISPSAARVKPN
jgi:hypothetical protein